MTAYFLSYSFVFSQTKETSVIATQEKDNKIKSLEAKIAEYVKAKDEMAEEISSKNAEIKAKDQEKEDKIKTLEAEIRVFKKQMRSKGTEIVELQEINSVKKERQEEAERENQEKDDKLRQETQRYVALQQAFQLQLQQLLGRMDGVSLLSIA